MKETTREKLKSFAACNDWASPRPNDMERFWGFVIEAFNNGEHNILFNEFWGVICDHFHNKDTILNEWFPKYFDGIELLRQFTRDSHKA